MPVVPSPAAGRLSTPPSGSVTHEERRHLTVLFADLSGFSALSARLDPEEVREVANLCFGYLNRAIIQEGGTVHKYEGDLVMALFGYPAAHEDDPERALRAAFKMFRLLPDINSSLSFRLRTRTDLGLHVGVNSGTVVVGEVGAEGKTEVTVMGDAVNLGSRLKDMARRGEIMVSEPVFRASRYLFEYEACEPVAVKGIETPVRVFRPLRERDVPEPKRGIQGLHSPLIGREEELRRLEEAVEALSVGGGGAVFLLGDAGLGKSRLLEELRAWMGEKRQVPVILLEGRCPAYGESVPYLPFLQVLGTVFGIREQDERDRVREKLLARTRELFPDSWAEVAPYLGYLFSVRFEGELDERVRHLDAKALRTQIFVGVRKLLSTLFRAQPLLLVIEDYHWIDRESLELLEFLFEAPEPFPMLLLALSRVEKEKEGHKVKERLKEKLKGDFLDILLQPLSQEAGSQLVHNLLQVSGLPKEFKTKVLAQAEGNPFYLEEIVRALIDSNAIVYQSGVWRLAADFRSFSIPDTVQAVIASRLDCLERDAREVLQTAAVIGRNFYIPVLERLSGLASLMLTLYLAELEEREYVSERQRDPDLEYVFRHPLLQEVTYNGLLKKRRCELHRKAGETIEGLYRDRLEEFTELLAYQYAQGDDPGKAVAWLARAGQRAVDRYAHDEAIAYYGQLAKVLARDFPGRKAEQSAAQEAIGDAYSMKAENAPALEAYEAMGRTGGGDRLVQARSLKKIAGVYQKQSRYDESFAVLERAEKVLSGELPEEAMERAEIRFMRCWGYQAKGDLDRAIKEGEAGLNAIAALLRENPSGVDLRKAKRIKAKGLNYMAVTYWNKAEHGLAIEFNEALLKLSEEISDKIGMGTACGNLGILYHDLGDYSRAVPYYERSYAISQAIGDRQQMIRVCGNLGIVHYERGEYDRALEVHQDYLRNTQEIGARQGEVSAHINLGLVYFDRGDWPRARECQMRALALADEIGYLKGAGIASLNLGTLHLETGDWAEAEPCLLKAEAVMDEIQDKFTMVEVYTLLALLKSKTSRPASLPDRQALAYLEKASALTREIGSKYTLPRIHFVYGALYAAAGDYPRSEEEFKKSVAMYSGLAQPKNQADAWLEYARMLKAAEGKGASLEGRSAEGKGAPLEGRSEEAFGKARKIYQDLKLAYKVKECQ